MPQETQKAVNVVIGSTYTDEFGYEETIKSTDFGKVVDGVRSYFNEHSISYTSFSYNDLKSFLN